jgi:RNA polymerase sigma factor (TIGR02999 family)
MRRILVENARRKKRIRHGGGLERVPLDSIDLALAQNNEQCIQISECLDQLAKEDPEKAEIVKLRVFAGLGMAEIAALLGCSDKTVQRHWIFARAWLNREMTRSNTSGGAQGGP